MQKSPFYLNSCMKKRRKIDILEIPTGSELLIGAPSVPMDMALATAITDAVSRCHGIIEAHLPQCYIEGVMKIPSQVIVVSISNDFDSELVIERLQNELEASMPSNHTIDIWPATQNMPLLSIVRAAGCQIYQIPLDNTNLKSKYDR